MKLLIVAAGRLKAGPEPALAADYMTRARGMGRALGFSGLDTLEVEGKPLNEPQAEATAILRATPAGAVPVLLDERGAQWSSRELAERLALWRDRGRPCVTFWIGGADGASQTLKDRASEMLAFGRQTWPHRLVRVMLAEQIYRALTILSGTPYHRD